MSELTCTSVHRSYKIKFFNTFYTVNKQKFGFTGQLIFVFESIAVPLDTLYLVALLNVKCHKCITEIEKTDKITSIFTSKLQRPSQYAYDGSFNSWHKASSTSTCTSIPAPQSFSIPLDATMGFGSVIPTTTSFTFALIRASVQGGVLP
jgi:hypothetical protein